ncbi:MAG: carboxylating nicotinate-nucleotide diphosphorylase [Candidatus Thiodiazotropha taylori]
MNLHSNHFLLFGQVSQALAEDLGSGDLTAALLPADAVTQARIICREQAVICGIAWVNEVYRQLDPDIGLEWSVEEGEMVSENQPLCRLTGNARALLSGERCALNYLQSLSGTATLTRRYVEAVSGIDVRILDTRKTVPGLRLQQKYAVRCGGGHNHRVGLYDAVLIKENHIRAAGSIEAALVRSREVVPDGVSVEIEVETLDELQQALDAGVQRVLLDNFTPEKLREAVKLAAGRARLEASGGINLDTIREIAESGIDDISVGALTKDIRAIDLSMLFEL